MRGPAGANVPKESVFVEVAAPERGVLTHESGPRFEMTITFAEPGAQTMVGWRQVFDTAGACRRVATCAAANLDRLTAVVREGV